MKNLRFWLKSSLAVVTLVVTFLAPLRQAALVLSLNALEKDGTPRIDRH